MRTLRRHHYSRNLNKDYDKDYDPTKQEKAEMELYEKELEDLEARQQKAEMELIERQFEHRTEKLENVMNFSKGATSNMRADDKNTESEDELVDMTKQDQVIIEEKGGRPKRRQ
jgi:hypothetical protein